MAEDNFLPLLDLTTKSLSVQGLTPLGAPNASAVSGHVRLEMERFGMHIDTKYRHKYQKILPQKPAHLIHATWCLFNDSKRCTCQLRNPSPACQIWIRVEATPVAMPKQTHLGVVASKYGEEKLLKAINDTYNSQLNQFPTLNDLKKTLTYPVLDTKWNKQHGKDAWLSIGTKPIKSRPNTVSDKPTSAKSTSTQPQISFYFPGKLETEMYSSGLVPSFRPKTARQSSTPTGKSEAFFEVIDEGKKRKKKKQKKPGNRGFNAQLRPKSAMTIDSRPDTIISEGWSAWGSEAGDLISDSAKMPLELVSVDELLRNET